MALPNLNRTLSCGKHMGLQSGQLEAVAQIKLVPQLIIFEIKMINSKIIKIKIKQTYITVGYSNQLIALSTRRLFNVSLRLVQLNRLHKTNRLGHFSFYRLVVLEKRLLKRAQLIVSDVQSRQIYCLWWSSRSRQRWLNVAKEARQLWWLLEWLFILALSDLLLLERLLLARSELGDTGERFAY